MDQCSARKKLDPDTMVVLISSAAGGKDCYPKGKENSTLIGRDFDLWHVVLNVPDWQTQYGK